MVSLSGAVEAPWRTPASNRDDHTRQHSYLMDQRGQWRLAPAYDLTYSAAPGGEHYLDVEGEGKNPTANMSAPWAVAMACQTA